MTQIAVYSLYKNPPPPSNIFQKMASWPENLVLLGKKGRREKMDFFALVEVLVAEGSVHGLCTVICPKKFKNKQ